MFNSPLGDLLIGTRKNLLLCTPNTGLLRRAVAQQVETGPSEQTCDGIEVGANRPRLMFDRKCKRTIEDMLAYRYPDNTDAKEPGSDRYDRPLKSSDHGPEALGRFFAGKFGQFGKTNGTKVHQATFAREEPGKIQVAPKDWYKSEEFKRPAAHENRRTEFPKVNNALSNFLKGAYDD